MQYSTNYHMNKPELNEQYRLTHWNENTDIVDSELKKVNNRILTFITNNRVLSGEQLEVGHTIKILFTADVTGTDESTVLNITYNGTDIPVKVNCNGALVNFVAREIQTNTFKYLQAYTTIEMIYDGTQFIIIGNPVVLSDVDVTVYADGRVGDEPVGTVKALSTVNIPYGWAKGDGSAISRTKHNKLFTKYSTEKVMVGDVEKTLLEIYGQGDGSTTFNIPDYQEIVLVGDGENIVDKNAGNLATHDVYTVGKFKDDCLQKITGSLATNSRITNNSTTMPTGAFNGTYTSDAPAPQQGYVGIGSFNFDSSRSTRSGTTTHGKQKGVKYIVKVL